VHKVALALMEQWVLQARLASLARLARLALLAQ
jgi:hypothetical protein